MPPTAIVEANMKVNEAELKKSGSLARGTAGYTIYGGTYSFLIAAQKFEVGKRTAENGVTATIRHYGIISKLRPRFAGTEGKQCAA